MLNARSCASNPLLSHLSRKASGGCLRSLTRSSLRQILAFVAQMNGNVGLVQA